MEHMTKREFTVLHQTGKLGLLTAGMGTLDYISSKINTQVPDQAAAQKFLIPVTRADIDGSDTSIFEDYIRGIIYVYNSYKRQGDGTQINHVTAYARYL